MNIIHISHSTNIVPYNLQYVSILPVIDSCLFSTSLRLINVCPLCFSLQDIHICTTLRHSITEYFFLKAHPLLQSSNIKWQTREFHSAIGWTLHLQFAIAISQHSLQSSRMRRVETVRQSHQLYVSIPSSF